MGSPYPDSSPERDRGVLGEEEAAADQDTAAMVTGSVYLPGTRKVGVVFFFFFFLPISGWSCSWIYFSLNSNLRLH